MPPITPDAQADQMPVPTPQQQGDTAAAGPQPSQATPDNTQAAPVSGTTVPPAGTPTAAPAAAPTAQSIGDKSKHILGDIFQTIAGGQKVVWQQGPNGPVKTYQDLKPGEMARGILAAAITGLASGYDPANRGHGPAMSSAFSAGFKGEQEQRDKQAGQQEKEAQQTFANQNASDELLMKKQRFAQEQQQSILDMQKTHQIMSQAAEKARQEGIVFTQEQQTFLQNQDNKFYASKIAGGKEIQDPKNPGQDLVLHTQEEANRYIADHKDQLLAPGDFDTRPFQRPGTGGWVILKTPLSLDEKREVRFAKIGKDGKPEQDKDGNYIPSGEKDQSGHVIPPVTLSGAEYRNKMKEVIDYKEASAKWQDSLAQAEERRAIALKDINVSTANKQLLDAGNDPMAMDVNTGRPKMPFKSRMALQSFYLENQRAAEANINKMNTAAASMDPNSQEAKDLRAAIEKTQAQADQYKAAIASVNDKSVTPADAMTRSLIVDQDGDPTKALQLFDKQAKAGKYNGNLRDDQITAIRAKLSDAIDQQKQKKEAPAPKDDFGVSSPTSKLNDPAHVQIVQSGIAKDLQGGVSVAQARQNIIQDNNFSIDDKKKLLAGLPKPEDGKVAMISEQGQIVNATPEERKTLETGGYKVLGEKPAPVTEGEKTAAVVAPFGR
jgi:hypothetical protein